MSIPFAFWNSWVPTGPDTYDYTTQNLSISVTVPSGCTTCVAELWGCGGNGGLGDSFQGGGGGGGGSYCKKTFSVVSGNLITGQVGAGGSIYPTELVCAAQSVSLQAVGGSNGYDATVLHGGIYGAGGSGGLASGGDVNNSGTSGTDGDNSGNGGNGGAGAGLGGSTSGGAGGLGNSSGGLAAGNGVSPGGGGGGGADATNQNGGTGGNGRWKIVLS